MDQNLSSRYQSLNKDRATPQGKQLAGADVIASFRKRQPNPPPAPGDSPEMPGPNDK